MMNLTQDLYEALKPFEKQLRQVFYGDYLPPMSSLQATDLIKIYVKAGGKESMSPTCTSCKMNLCKKLGRLYFEWQEKAESAPNNDGAEQVPAPDTKAQQKAKKGAGKGK